MNERGFNNIFRNISGNLYCPACGSQYNGDEINSVVENDKGLVISVSCKQCHLTVMMNVMTLSSMSGTARAELVNDNPIPVDEVISFSKSLKSFDGNFRRAFIKIDRNR